MKALHLPLVIILSVLTVWAYGQQNTTYQKKQFTISKHSTTDVAAIKNDWNVRLRNIDNPKVGNKAYADFVKQIKIESGIKYPKKNVSVVPDKGNTNKSADTCVVLKGFEGNAYNNHVPNDNTLAVSNNGMLVSAINSTIYMYDTQNDTLLKTVSLTAFSDTLQLNSSQYDPKLLYDPQADKFVMVYLAGHDDSTSNIIVAFSQTNDPVGLWNLYYLPGNPLSDTSWSDFPAIALTEDELFITINLLRNGGSWQTSFKQSVVWQIDKNKGYTGDTLKTKLWSDIQTAGRPIRNINPIQGGSDLQGPDIFLLSNRNFAIQNDTIFLLHISNVMTDTNATLTITPYIADKSYGMPPDADQPSNQTLATNDARVLGGFIENDRIQFVGNTIDTLSGLASFYHGILNTITSANLVHLTIMSDTVEFGYPNISYTGVGSTDNSAIITVDYSGKFTFPGFCAFNYKGNTGVYSSRGNLKSGNSYVNILSGVDRWGDYSGSQRVYNEPGKVWVSGFYGKKVSSFTRVIATWIAQLQKAAPDAGIQSSGGFVNTSNVNAYPNPVSDLLFVEVTIPYDALIDVALYDENGKLIKLLMHGKAREGKNILSFSTTPLSKGMYFLTVKDISNQFLTKKIVKE